MEADLHRFYRRDYRDRWNPSARLTFRQLAVMVRHLPPESAVAQIERPLWSPADSMLDDIRRTSTMNVLGRDPGAHPSSPAAAAERERAKVKAVENEARRQRARERHAERERLLKEGAL